MILTYKLKHDRNFEHELSLAQKVADYGVQHKSISSKEEQKFFCTGKAKREIILYNQKLIWEMGDMVGEALYYRHHFTKDRVKIYNGRRISFKDQT